MRMDRVVFWDFHGTLAKPDKIWTYAMMRVLEDHGGTGRIGAEDLAPWLRSGFPWQEPEKDYRDRTDPEVWWAAIARIFEKAYAMNGIDPEAARRYARDVRKYLVDPGFYSLYEDSMETLEMLRSKGYHNVILSNHIPELPDIARRMGLMEAVESCISSANVGYEKPNAHIFRIALEMTGRPGLCWMVGDNAAADVFGAEAAGIRAILVREPPEGQAVRHFSTDLRGAASIILGGTGEVI